MRSPVDTTRSVNGVLQIVKEDKPPFKFDGGELTVTASEAEELREHSKFGVMFEEVPNAVKRVADKPKNKAKAPKTPSKPASDEVKITKVESVTNFNEATVYLKEEFGLEHKDVNSKDKIVHHAAALALEFPNYADLNPDTESEEEPESE